MQQLEQAVGMCAHKLRVLRSPYVSEEDIKHYNCDDFNKECFVPFNPQGEPVRQGVIAYHLMKYRGLK